MFFKNLREKYLELIYRLSLNSEDIKISDLVKNLNLTVEEVNKEVDRLKNQNYLIISNDKILLTIKGQNLGKKVYNDMINFKHIVNALCDPSYELPKEIFNTKKDELPQ